MAVFDVTPNIGGNRYAAGGGISLDEKTVSIRTSGRDNNATSISENGIYTYIPFQGKMFPLIEVTVQAETSSGILVTATHGEATVSGMTNADGIATLELGAFGPWTVQATYGGSTGSETIDVTRADIYSVRLYLFPATIFGVVWDMSNSSPEMMRLTPESDPNGYVNEVVSSEPSPAVGTEAGSSPFDHYLPWMEMKEVNIVDGDIIAPDSPLFSRTANDTMIYIPPFYYKIISSEDMIYFYIADNKISGFELHPGSNTYVARYRVKIENGVFTSKSGGTPSYGSSFNADYARSYATKKGSGWQIFDYSTWCAIFLLYAVEFADWRSQALIGPGQVNASAGAPNGATDDMIYHTGKKTASTSSSPMQYRGIEELWGSYRQLTDGVNKLNGNMYICLDPTKYGGSIPTDYIDLGPFSSNSGYITRLNVIDTYNWCILPDQSGGSSSTYIPDRANIRNASESIYMSVTGGDWNDDTDAGIGYFLTNDSPTVGTSCRIEYRAPKGA